MRAKIFASLVILGLAFTSFSPVKAAYYYSRTPVYQTCVDLSVPFPGGLDPLYLIVKTVDCVNGPGTSCQAEVCMLPPD